LPIAQDDRLAQKVAEVVSTRIKPTLPISNVRYQLVLPPQLPGATLEAPIVCATQLNMKVT